jgi:hypothetical protein
VEFAGTTKNIQQDDDNGRSRGVGEMVSFSTHFFVDSFKLFFLFSFSFIPISFFIFVILTIVIDQIAYLFIITS